MQNLKNAYSVAYYAKNIENILIQTTEKDYFRGVSWYQDAHEIANAMCSSTIKAAGIISALSANCEWTHNVSIAKHFFKTWKVKHTKTTRRKVWNIFHMQNPTEEKILKVLNAPKTSNFFLNILHPDKSDIVTIDRHAAALAGLDTKKHSVTPYKYKQIAEAYRIVAGKDFLANQLQAITWVYWKANKSLQASKAYH